MILGAFLGFSVASCADQNFDWEEAKSQNPEYTFRTNFESLVGTIDPNQSWDLSSNEATLGTRAIETIKTEKVAGLDFNIGLNNTVRKNTGIYNNVKSILPDGTKQTGKSVVLVAPDNGFYVYPVSTVTSTVYKMYVKVGDNSEVEVFNKDWSANDKNKPHCNGMTIDRKVKNMGGLYVEAPLGTPVQIYIKRDNGQTVCGTTNEWAIYVNAGDNIQLESLPSNVPSGAKVKYIGIEDWPDKTNSDLDYNDLVVAVVGMPEVPGEIEIKENTYDVPTEIKKRYMVEDLGSTAKTDIDFNDLVIDMVESTVAHHKVTRANGVITKDEITGTTISQKAVVRAMGGTLDFEFLVGGSPIFKKSEHLSDFGGIEVKTMYNTTAGEIDYEAEYEIELEGTPWSPTNNNVSFRVWRSESTTSHSVPGTVTSEFPEPTVTEFAFPTPGSVPYIIAFDADKKWRKERQKICSHFLYGTLDGDDECDVCGAGDTDYKVEGE